MVTHRNCCRIPVALSKGSTRRSKLRHIDARQAWVEAMRDDFLVTLEWVPTAGNLADLNLKFLGIQSFEKLRNRIMVLKPRAIPVYAPHTA